MGFTGRRTLPPVRRHNFYISYTFVRARGFNPAVLRSCHARGGPKQMGFEEEAAVSPTENVFREGFLVIFCLYVAWDESATASEMG